MRPASREIAAYVRLGRRGLEIGHRPIVWVDGEDGESHALEQASEWSLTPIEARA